MRKKCRHNKRKTRCIICKGAGICKHKKDKYMCLECNGGGICKHKKQRHVCIICKGASVCNHGKLRNTCKICRPLSHAKTVLRWARRCCKKFGYATPDITPEGLVNLYNVSTHCVGCGGPLNWGHDNRHQPHLHHNHVTGEVLGFCHALCNQAEGMLSKLSSKEIVTFVKTFFPAVFDE